MSQVTILAPYETVEIDSQKLIDLYRQLGPIGAEDILCRAMEDLAGRMASAEQNFHEGKAKELRKTARAISAIAVQIGMVSVSAVATSMSEIAEKSDHAAQAAVLARLLRNAEGSLSAVWDLQGLSV